MSTNGPYAGGVSISLDAFTVKLGYLTNQPETFGSRLHSLDLRK